MADKYEALKLKNQLCFPLYACGKGIVKRYKPFSAGGKARDKGYCNAGDAVKVGKRIEIAVNDIHGDSDD